MGTSGKFGDGDSGYVLLIVFCWIFVAGSLMSVISKGDWQSVAAFGITSILCALLHICSLLVRILRVLHSARPGGIDSSVM